MDPPRLRARAGPPVDREEEEAGLLHDSAPCGAPRRRADRHRKADVTAANGEAPVDVFAPAFVRGDGTQVLFVWSKQNTFVNVRLPPGGIVGDRAPRERKADAPRALTGATLPGIDVTPGDVRLFEIRP